MIAVIIFILVLAVLIFVHELGHYILAKANGIRVDAFKIGFGPRILSWTKGETEFGLNLVPFGGFVKIHGEDPDESLSADPDLPRSFIMKNRFRQITVLAAGVFFNFLFAWILYLLLFASGITATKEGFDKYSSYMSGERIMVTYVEKGSPAEESGLKIGDVISGASSIEEVQKMINESSGRMIDVSFLRRGESMTATVTPITGLVENKYAIGIAMSDVVDLKLPFFASIVESVRYTGLMIRETAVGLFNFIANMFRGTANFADVSGPVGIAGIVGSASQLGFSYLLMITALISINLGVINLVPFPALDGGRILFVLVEGLVRRRIPPRFANAVNALGFILLMVLMIVVTYKDIAKLVK